MPVCSDLLPSRPRWLEIVEVSGPSMVPTLRHGDRVLALRVGRRGVRPGEVVLARFRDLPGHVVVKRAVRPADGGWWLASDNPFAGGDSASHGVADVTARVVLRLGPGRPRRPASPPPSPHPSPPPSPPEGAAPSEP